MKDIFKKGGRQWPEFALAAALFVLNVILALTLPYYSVHSRYYDGGAYVVVLSAAFVTYTLYLLAAKKKSTSDIAVILVGFFLLWELSFKLVEGLVGHHRTVQLQLLWY